MDLWNRNIVTEAEYLEVLATLRRDHTLSDEDINRGEFTASDTNRQIILNLLAKLNKYKLIRLNIYKKLLKECVPVSPYAREQTQAESIRFKEQEIEIQRKRIRYTDIEYTGPVSILPTGYGPDYML